MLLEILNENISAALLFGSIVFLVFYCFWNKRPTGIPPFPVTPLPIVGNLLSLAADPTDLFAKWRKEHGDIFSLYMGSKLHIFLNGFGCVKEALVQNADVFSARPDVALFTDILKNRTVFSTSGGRWKSLRTFVLTALRDFGFGRKSQEGKILEESENVVKHFESKGGVKTRVDSIFNMAPANVLCSVVFGRRYEYDDPVFIDCCKSVSIFLEALPSTGLVNALPFLRYLPGDLSGFKKAIRAREDVMKKLVTPEIKRHCKEYDGTVNDFVSAYIKEIKDREAAGEDMTAFKDGFEDTILDLFIAGTDTTGITLKWLILFFIHYPEVQERCFQEIKVNVGFGRLPELKDKPLLPYVEATLAETQRLGNIGPYIPHGVEESTVFRGFNFPKEAVVMVNLASILKDPKTWPNPDEFHPERFLDKDGTFHKPPEFIPFSAGRRVCLGEALAKMELFLIGSALIQRFCFEQPEDDPLPSLKPVLGLTSSPGPYKVRAKSRN